MDIDEEPVYDDPDPEDSNYTSESSVTDQAISPEQETPPQRQSARQKPSNYLTVFVPKRKRSGPVDDEDIIEHRAKIMRAMAALAHDTIDKETQLVIPVPETYDEAIKDPIWGRLWLEAIQAELTTLVANGTWDVVPYLFLPLLKHCLPLKLLLSLKLLLPLKLLLFL